MPELPDVEVMRRRLEETSMDRPAERVEVRDGDLVEGSGPGEFADRLRGSRFLSSRRHGKYLFAETDAGPWVLFHFGMSGFLRHFEESPGEPEYPKVLWHFREGGSLAFDCRRKLGQVRLVPDPDRFVEEKRLGPDALEGMDRNAFLGAMSGRRGMLKTALMRQEILAGVGNEMSDEILYQLRLHPRTGLPSLEEEQLAEVHGVMRATLEGAIAAREAGDAGAFPGPYLLPHREEGTSCPRCGGEVRRIEISGRGSYFCPDCQGEG